MTLFRDGKCEPLKRWPEWAQIAGFSACALFINLVIGLMISSLGMKGSGIVKQEMITGQGYLFSFFLLVIVAPFTETIYGQWLPLFTAKIAKRTPTVQILWASCWFALLHIPHGFVTVIKTIFVGWVLACCFLFCKEDNWLKAYRVTSAVHAIHNLVLFLLFLFFLSQSSSG